MRIGFFDIEASNLNANFGRLMTCSLKPLGDKHIIKIKKGFGTDKRAIKDTIEALNQFDMIVTWYGVRYDIPFVKTRALITRVSDFIDPRIRHLDLWHACKMQLKFTSNRLETVSTDINTVGQFHTAKTRISGEIWNRAIEGDARALAYVLDHNVKDVIVLEDVYNEFVEQGIIRQIKTIPRI